MDHLPRPHDATPDHIQVPYIAKRKFAYKGRGLSYFNTFHWRHGFLLECLDATHDAEETASFIQSWLYFGLLAEFLRAPVDHSKFVRSAGGPVAEGKKGLGPLYVSSLALKDLPFKLRTLEDEEKDEYYMTAGGFPVFGDRYDREWGRLSRLMRYADGQWEDLDGRFRSAPEPLPTVLLSVRVLMDTLYTVCMGYTLRLDSSMMYMEKNNKALDAGSSAAGRKISEVMLERGWCPSQINHILRSFRPAVACYATQLRRYRGEGITHAWCSEDTCVAFNVDPKTYKTRHIGKGCSNVECPTIRVPFDELKKIVESGGIPLVSVVRSKTGGVRLLMKAASASDTYIAFSHVWSDGLGSNENSIPLCQLEKLERHLERVSRIPQRMSSGSLGSMDMMRLSDTYRTRLFWLDTLCIPARPWAERREGDEEDYEIFRRLKRSAISTITPTFAGASRVIILDSEIMENLPAAAHGSDWTERTLRFLCSTWIGRCWTLEEGAISPAWQVQCANGGCFIPDMPDPTTERDFGMHLLYGQSTTPHLVWTLIRYGALAIWDRVSLEVAGTESIRRASHRRTFERRTRMMLNVPLQNAVHSLSQNWMGGSVLDSDAKTAMEQFIVSWNSLTRRQTSRAEDRLIILANLMEINSLQVTKPGSKVLPIVAFLRSLPGVPLSLLFDPGPKAMCPEANPHPAEKGTSGSQGGEEQAPSSGSQESADNKEVLWRPDDFNRWLPLHPGVFELTSDDYMTWKDDFLYLEEAPLYTQLLWFEDPRLTHADTAVFPAEEKYQEKERYQYRVEFLRQAQGGARRHLPKQRVVAACLLIDRDDDRQSTEAVPGELRGTCLQVFSRVTENAWEDDGEYMAMRLYFDPSITEGRRSMSVGSRPLISRSQPEPVSHITAVYDCPVHISVERLEKGSSSQHANIDSRSAAISQYRELRRWSLRLHHNCPASAAVPPRVRAIDFSAFSAAFNVLVAAFFGTTMVLPSKSLLVASSFKLFRGLPPIAKAVVALDCFWNFGGGFSGLVLQYNTLSVAVTAAHLWVKSKHVGPLSRMDYWYGVLSISGNTLIVLGGAFYKFYIAPQVYREWVAGYGRNPPPDTKLRRWVYKVTSFVKSYTEV